MSNINQRPHGPGSGPADGQLGQSKPKAGSVKRARLRVEAGLPPSVPLSAQFSGPDDANDAPGVPPLRPGGRSPKRQQYEEFQRPLHAVQVSRSKDPMTLAATRRPTPGVIGAAISKPAPTAQWPLREGNGGTSRRLNNSPTRAGPGTRRRTPPPRPKRPSYVPSLVDVTSPVSPLSPESALPSGPARSDNQLPRKSPEYWEGTFEQPSSDFLSPSALPSSTTSSYTPSGGSSRPSTVSSAGSIPDFPIPSSVPPMPTPPPRKSTNYGPPPTMRRGASSYYSQYSYVAPIPEEASDTRRSQGSVASSRVIPDTWEPRTTDDFATAQTETVSDGDDGEDDEDGRISRGTNDDEEQGLVRKASLGQRHKASLTTIKSLERFERESISMDPTRPGRLSRQSRESISAAQARQSMVGRNAVAAGATGAILAAGLGASPDKDSQGSTKPHGQLRNPHQLGGDSLLKPPVAITTNSATMSPPRSPLTSPGDPRVNSILNGYRRESADSRRGSSTILPPSKYSDRSDRTPGLKRPPRLNLDAVRGGESRGSLTSLPDLIKRATALASVLDRGRPASRWDAEFPPLPDESEKEKGVEIRIRRSGSLSDILASFPSPGLREGAGSRGSRWPSPLADPDSPLGVKFEDDSLRKRMRRRRKCCGLPLRVFIVLVIGFLIVAAAIVLPVTLVVLPRQQNREDPSLVKCKSQLSCSNGGSVIADGDTCRCLCVNGFTGKWCTVAPADGCVTTDIKADDSTIRNASVGSAIPRLLEEGSKNFSIPLSASKVLSRFSTGGLSCNSENALVTFNGLSGPASPPTNDSPTPADVKRDLEHAPKASITFTPPTVAPAMATINGIVFASDMAPTARPTVTDSPSSRPSSNPSSSFEVDDSILDFARVSVLYILQESNFDKAVAAQGRLQNFVALGQGSRTVDVGSGMTVDFEDLTLDLGSGDVGGKA
ncbi:MAG: hypothetical protein M1833_006031 [Piccolia ochrophora]|nr:MAG: hypothetical protein M1833_006031 [Piccolia ochrophora]